MSTNKQRNKLLILSIPVLLVAGMLFSCENDLGTIKSITATDETPNEIANDLHTLYSDSGIVMYEIIATRMETYGEPINKTIFKDGFQVNIFKEKDSIVSTLTADYAEIKEKENTIVARNNVIFTNFEKKQTLKTEELYWDRTLKRIKTDKQFTVIGEKSVVTGYGLDADESFTEYNAHKVQVRSEINDTLQ